MHATSVDSRPSAFRHFVFRVGAEEAQVRATAIWPVAEVLDGEVGPQAFGPVAADADLLRDLLESSMIAPPRPRRRRQRAVSSRAVFYQAAESEAVVA